LFLYKSIAKATALLIAVGSLGSFQAANALPPQAVATISVTVNGVPVQSGDSLNVGSTIDVEYRYSCATDQTSATNRFLADTVFINSSRISNDMLNMQLDANDSNARSATKSYLISGSGLIQISAYGEICDSRDGTEYWSFPSFQLTSVDPDQAAADAVKALINAAANASDWAAARVDYDALTATQQALVSNYNLLTAYEDAAAALAAAITAGNTSLTDYTTAGGLNTDALWVTLNTALAADPAVLADITAATAALDAATDLLVATAAVVAAETSVAQADVTSASALVAALPAGADKTALEARLVTVQAAIDAAAGLAAAITAATTAVTAAETSAAQADVTSASALVAALPAGADKTALEARLVIVQAAIDAAAAAVTAATNAVLAAETAVTQVSVTSASTLVNALPAGTAKTALLARLAVVQAAVTAALTPPTPVNTVAGAPTAVSATAGNAVASVSWTAPTSNGGSAITNYQIEYSSDSGATWTVFVRTPSTATSATVTGLVNGTAYTFRIKAVNAVGNSAASSGSASVTPVAPVVVPVDKSAIAKTTFSGTSTKLSAKQKAGLRAYFESFASVERLTIQVVGYANSRTSTKTSLAAATARAKAVVVFLKTLGIDATITSKGVGKGSKAQAILNIKWVE